MKNAKLFFGFAAIAAFALSLGASSLNKKSEAIQTKADVVVENLGTFSINENTGPETLYVSPDNATSIAGGWGTYCWPKAVSGYTTGSIRMNGVEISSGSLALEHINNEAVGFAIGRGKIGQGVHNVGDILTIEGLFQQSGVESYFYIEKTEFVFTGSYSFEHGWLKTTLINELGSLMTNANTGSEKFLFANTEVDPGVYDGWNQKSATIVGGLTFNGEAYNGVVESIAQNLFAFGRIDSTALTNKELVAGDLLTIGGIFKYISSNFYYSIEETTFIWSDASNGWFKYEEVGGILTNANTGYYDLYFSTTVMPSATPAANTWSHASINGITIAGTVIVGGEAVVDPEVKLVGPAGYLFQPVGINNVTISGTFFFDIAKNKVAVNIMETEISTISSSPYWQVTRSTEDAQKFVDAVMHMSDISTSNTAETGACLGNAGYYAVAKAAYEALSAAGKKSFDTDAQFAEARNRLAAWALANGETYVPSSGLVAQTNVMEQIATNNSVIIIVAAVALISLYAVVALKKRKHN